MSLPQGYTRKTLNRWADPELAMLLKDLWENTALTAREISVRLGNGITRNAVLGKRRRMNLKRRESPVLAEQKEMSYARR